MSLISSDVTEKATVAATSSGCVRVLHLNAGNLYGGVETLLTTLARFRRRCPGMEPHFGICYEGRYSGELREAGVPVYDLGPVRISQPWTVWRARRRLGEVLRSGRFDMVVCHMPWSLAVFGPAVSASGKRLAFWAHASYRGTGWLERLASRAVPDIVIANSRFTAGSLSKLFFRNPSVIYCPALLEDAPDAAQWRAALRKEHGIADETIVVLQVSRLEPWKGHRLHLRALSKLPQGHKWVTWIVGGPQKPEEEQYLRELRETAEELGIASQVQFLGQRSDVPKLLAACDIFCQPNQEPEPFGLVFIEALWAGRPVISSALGGALEIVNESCGILATPGDPDSLTSALLRLIESPALRDRLGAAGAARASQLCDPATQMEKLRNVLQAAAARTNS